MSRKNLIMALIAISLGVLISMVSWLVKPMPWRYTFSSSHLPAFLNSANSLKLIPVIVFIAFEAMFIYTNMAPINALIMLIAIIPVMSIKFVSVHMNVYLHIVFLSAILTAAISLWLVKGAVHPFRINCMDRWGAMFLLYMWFSLPRAHFLNIGLKEVLSLSTLFLTYFSVRFLVQNKKDIIRLLKWISFISSVVAIQAIIQFCLMKKGMLSLYEERFYRVYTSFGDPTQLANFLIITAPLIAGILLSKEIRSVAVNLLGWSVLLPAIAAALFLTFSRSAWISICLTLMFFTLCLNRGFKKLICIPVLIIMVAGFFSMSQDHYVVCDSLPEARTRSLYARRAILFSSFSEIRKAPFIGIGPGNFSYTSREYDTREMVNTAVPNTYLHTLTISGMIGFCIMALFLTLVLRTGQLYMKKGGPVFTGLYIGIVSNLMQGCFENLFYNIISNWMFGLVLGLMIAWQSERE